jgi:hypothetical protein
LAEAELELRVYNPRLPNSVPIDRKPNFRVAQMLSLGKQAPL